jgi:hypothetical protein
MQQQVPPPAPVSGPRKHLSGSHSTAQRAVRLIGEVILTYYGPLPADIHFQPHFRSNTEGAHRGTVAGGGASAFAAVWHVLIGGELSQAALQQQASGLAGEQAVLQQVRASPPGIVPAYSPGLLP